ncbi:adenosine deaminase [Candidatus Acetothermia bacterium]|nr:adenosine deaminase [Candidatus Acetothermia bacterium]MBI3460744.1 adenosine deaminase [Candidatus Acetothermia bacterium]MBI3660226.1 adenosine deaminase [Candidatus Acetothermia bacterium]
MKAVKPDDFLTKLPKIELHCHLDGSLRPETVWELAQQYNVQLPAKTQTEVKKFFNATGRKSLSDYLTLFGYTVPLLQTRDALRRATAELIEDFARENGKYIEIRYAPFLHLQKGLTPEQVVEATIEGLHEGEQKSGIRARLILCAMRQASPELALEVAQLAAQYKNKGVAAFDIAGPENGFPPERHRQAFEYAKANRLFVTIHAGEENCPDYIRQAIELGADRLGHGLHLELAPEAIQKLVIDRKIALEMCPTSNLQTKGWKSYSEHPIERYRRAGVLVTVNTDNRLMSDTTFTNELRQTQQAFGLRDEIARELMMNAARAAFLPETEKDELLKLVSQNS